MREKGEEGGRGIEMEEKGKKKEVVTKTLCADSVQFSVLQLMKDIY